MGHRPPVSQTGPSELILFFLCRLDDLPGLPGKPTCPGPGRKFPDVRRRVRKTSVGRIGGQDGGAAAATPGDRDEIRSGISQRLSPIDGACLGSAALSHTHRY